MKKPPTIDVIGAYAYGEGYPNSYFFLPQLLNSSNLTVDFDSGRRLAGMHLYSSTRSNLFSKLRLSFYSCGVSVLAVLRTLYRKKRISAVYIPYPSLPTLLLFSFIPRQLRPIIIADGFITLYDTIVIDRGLLDRNSWKARALYALERRSITACRHFICDTDCNADFYSELYKLPRDLFLSLPLSINENLFEQIPIQQHRREKLQVLFFGSFSPLHGIEVILGSAQLLKDKPNIHFTIIGTGQTAEDLEQILRDSANVSWIDEWVSNEHLSDYIREADIVLGVFGKTPKAKRVIPYKVYTALCAGRPVISGETGCSEILSSGVITLKCNDATRLAESILELQGDANLREDLSRQGRAFFKRHLGHPVRARALLSLAARNG